MGMVHLNPNFWGEIGVGWGHHPPPFASEPCWGYPCTMRVRIRALAAAIRYVRKDFMRRKIPREICMPDTMVLSPSLVAGLGGHQGFTRTQVGGGGCREAPLQSGVGGGGSGVPPAS